MLLQPECKPCIIRQAETAARLSGAGDEFVRQIKEEASTIVEAAPHEITAPELAAIIYGKIKEYTGVIDPYIEIKEKSLKEALSIYPHIERHIEASGDGLRSALVASAVGNVIDFGIPDISFSPQSIVEEYESLAFEIDDYERLKGELSKAETILFIADNAGEIVFDRFFLKWAKSNLSARVVFAVRGGPVINDATVDDAVKSGIEGLAEIIDTGTAIPGAVVRAASKKFREIFKESDLVISKGQGNFEVMEAEERQIFFILKAKCDAIAGYLSVKKGSLILMESGGKSR